jgi:hypothetical protein
MNYEELRQAIQSKINSNTARLEGLCKEKVQVSQLHYLCFDAMETCFEWYDHEIEVCNELIESYSKRLEEIKANETI